MQVIFETLRGEAGEKTHYRLETLEGGREKGEENQVLLDLQTAGDRQTGALRNRKGSSGLKVPFGKSLLEGEKLSRPCRRSHYTIHENFISEAILPQPPDHHSYPKFYYISLPGSYDFSCTVLPTRSNPRPHDKKQPFYLCTPSA